MMPLISGPIAPVSRASLISERLLKEMTWIAFQLFGTPLSERPHITKGSAPSSNRDASGSAAIAVTPGPLKSHRIAFVSAARTPSMDKTNMAIIPRNAHAPKKSADQSRRPLDDLNFTITSVIGMRGGAPGGVSGTGGHRNQSRMPSETMS